MPSGAREYRKLVWKTAWPKAWSTTRSWVALVAISLGMLALLLPQVEKWRTITGWGIPLAFLVVLLTYELVRTPFVLHAKLESEVEDLTERLTDRQDHKALADELVDKFEWAHHNLLNLNALHTGTSPGQEWLEKSERWKEEVEEILKRHHCDKSEMNAFLTMNAFDISQFAPFNSRVAMIFVRMDRIGRIAEDHRKRAHARELAPKR